MDSATKKSFLFRTGDPNFMTSLARGLEVIRAFRDAATGLSMAEISERTGLSRAVVRRCLFTLEEMGYVSRDRRVFQLEPKILTLGQSYLSSSSIPVKAQPFLEAVSQRVNESCSLAVLESDQAMYVARSATRRIMSVTLGIGSRLPAYCTSLGRVLLAHLPPADLRAYVDRTELVAYTEHTIVKPERLDRVFAVVREQGYALVDQELELGLRSIAVPIHGPSRQVVAAMNVGVQAGRVPASEMLETILPVIQEEAERLTAILLY